MGKEMFCFKKGYYYYEMLIEVIFKLCVYLDGKMY